ncbi:hypothetical protein [Micromonospora sp. NPDC049679]|uniref:hypothetical protein n=1 Tax=Micromonospora sp. NPDC049679 TaxID=3155920 RepID=UPI0033CD9335
MQDGVFHKAVYPDPGAGCYPVWWAADTPAGVVTVVGGAPAEFTWPLRRPGAVGRSE